MTLPADMQKSERNSTLFFLYGKLHTNTYINVYLYGFNVFTYICIIYYKYYICYIWRKGEI